MASANIAFDKTPASIRKPGKYFEYNTKLAVRTLPSNTQKAVLIGQRTAAGSVLAGQVIDIFSDDQASQYFGAGSMLHLMARAAITAFPYLSLQAVALDDAAADRRQQGSRAGGRVGGCRFWRGTLPGRGGGAAAHRKAVLYVVESGQPYTLHDVVEIGGASFSYDGGGPIPLWLTDVTPASSEPEPDLAAS